MVNFGVKVQQGVGEKAGNLEFIRQRNIDLYSTDKKPLSKSYIPYLPRRKEQDTQLKVTLYNGKLQKSDVLLAASQSYHE